MIRGRRHEEMGRERKPAASTDFMTEFRDPPREFSVMPFWFWNDDLREEELLRQIADFEAHGVYGFVIHPRIGLPKDIGWLSPRMLRCMRVAIEEAARRNLCVVLYDEGMYPSGSSSGQVVERNPRHAARGLAKIDLAAGENPSLPRDWDWVATLDRPGGQHLGVVERPSGGTIRGLHYLDEEPGKLEEHQPSAGDILNPAAVDSFIELVYERYAREFGMHFGKTILGIFTDEPSMLGRERAEGMMPGHGALLDRIGLILGYDFRPHLADLWYNDYPESEQRRTDYLRAVRQCLEDIYYRRLGEWCARHRLALTGHPGGSMDIGAERHFQIPGQDLVWRTVMPGHSALEGADSTVAKCAASAMQHLGRRRNANELYGAYGHTLTFDEMQWLANWCLIRGQNLLYPHAFYYSVRGPRRDERPPDVGPNAAWWKDYKSYADRVRRLCWLNTDSHPICDVAILGASDFLPAGAAKICFQHQRDFNYLEIRHLWEDAHVACDGIRLMGMHYRAMIVDGWTSFPEPAMPALKTLAENGRLLLWQDTLRVSAPGAIRPHKTPCELVSAIDALAKPDILITPSCEHIRYRHVVKDDRHVYLLFNEASATLTVNLEVPVQGRRQWLNPVDGTATRAAAEPVIFSPWEMKVLLACRVKRGRSISVAESGNW